MVDDDGAPGGISLNEALARLLTRRVAATEQPLDGEVSVAELYRQLIPYEVVRADLALAAKAEYDVAFLELMADGEYLEAEDRALLEAVEEELSSPEPGLAFLQDYAASHLRLHLTEVEKELQKSAEAGGGRGFGPGGKRGGVFGSVGMEEESGAAGGSDAAASSGASDATPGSDGEAAGATGGDAISCWSCGEDLPEKAGEARYCVWCGADLTVRPCEACGAHLQEGWRFCPRCGEEAG